MAAVLIVLNLSLMFGLAFSVNRVLVLTNDLNDTRLSQNAGCKRGNVSRESQRYVLDFLANTAGVVGEFATTPELRLYFTDAKPELERRLNAPELAEQPCDVLYPVPDTN